MSAVEKTNQRPDSYGPGERPDIILKAEEKKIENGYQTYKNIQCRMDLIELPETLKFAGVRMSEYSNFGNIGRYHENYKSLMMETIAVMPYTEVGYSGTFDGGGDYVFGCQVTTIENVPEGLVAFDTGLRKFAQITFRENSAYALVGGDDGPGDGMRTAGEYIKEIWLPENMDKVNLGGHENEAYTFIKEGKEYWCFIIEIYKVDISVDHEMCFYIPLKQ